MPFGLVVKNASEHAFSLLGIDPRAGILDTDKHPIVETLGTHMEQVWDDL